MRVDWGSCARYRSPFKATPTAGESEHRGFVANLEIPPLEVSGFNVLTRWTRRLKGDADMQVQAYIDQSDRNDFVLFGPKANLFDVEFQHSTPVRPHRLPWGSGYRRARTSIDPAFCLAVHPRQPRTQLGKRFRARRVAAERSRRRDDWHQAGAQRLHRDRAPAERSYDLEDGGEPLPVGRRVARGQGAVTIRPRGVLPDEPAVLRHRRAELPVRGGQSRSRRGIEDGLSRP